jgi:hypothetical protein
MRTQSNNSGPRKNAYSESKCTNWTLYDPFFAEARAAYKRFVGRIPSSPEFPKIISLPPLRSDFIHPCNGADVERKLWRTPPEQFKGLRAVFLLAGTRKQQHCWRSSLCCYGCYWRDCVFLHAHPFDLGGWNLDDLRTFYVDDVLVHEIAHHIDRFREADNGTKEGFANAFVQLNTLRRRLKN